MFSFQFDSHSNNFEERGATDLSSRPVAAKSVDMGSGHIFDATGKVWKQSDFLSRTKPPKAKMVQPDRICKLRDLVQVGRQCKKQTRTRFITSWKPRYIWITEDLLQLRWCHGKSRDLFDSDEHETMIDVCDIEAIRSVDGRSSACIELDIMDAMASRQFNAEKAKAANNDPNEVTDIHTKVLEKHVLKFDFTDARVRDEWHTALTSLCRQNLKYVLTWSDMDSLGVTWSHMN